MKGGNSTSLKVVDASRKEQFAAYEKLPTGIRGFLMMQVVDWNAVEILEAWQASTMGEMAFIKYLKRSLKKRDLQDSKEFYGPDHPAATS